MTGDLWLRRRLIELKIGFIFLTRLPLVHNEPMAKGELARALWTAPLVGVGGSARDRRDASAHRRAARGRAG
jgi:hypothetical protein